MTDKPDKENQPLTLKALREKAQLTQPELSRRIDISVRTITDWEAKNTIPRFDHAVILARELGVSLVTLAQSIGLDAENIPLADSEQNHIFHQNISRQNDILDENKYEGQPKVFLRDLRYRLNISQERLAAFIGVTTQTISRCERGLTEITLTVLEFKRLCRLAKKTLIEDLPDYLGKPPEEDPEKQQE